MESIGEIAYNLYTKSLQNGEQRLEQDFWLLPDREQKAWNRAATQVLGQFHSDLILELAEVPRDCRASLVAIVDAVACRLYASKSADSVVNTPPDSPENSHACEKLHTSHEQTASVAAGSTSWNPKPRPCRSTHNRSRA